MKHFNSRFNRVRSFKRLLIVAVASLSIAVQAYQPAHALVSTTEVLARVAALVVAEEEKGNQILFAQIDNVGREASKAQTYPLSAGTEYRIWALGDEERITDIDLCVFTARNRQIGCDNDETNAAVVNFTPTADGQYTLQTTAASMNGSVRDGFFGLVVVRVDE